MFLFNLLNSDSHYKTLVVSSWFLTLASTNFYDKSFNYFVQHNNNLNHVDLFIT